MLQQTSLVFLAGCAENVSYDKTILYGDLAGRT